MESKLHHYAGSTMHVKHTTILKTLLVCMHQYYSKWQTLKLDKNLNNVLKVYKAICANLAGRPEGTRSISSRKCFCGE